MLHSTILVQLSAEQIGCLIICVCHVYLSFLFSFSIHFLSGFFFIWCSATMHFIQKFVCACASFFNLLGQIYDPRQIKRKKSAIFRLVFAQSYKSIKTISVYYLKCNVQHEWFKWFLSVFLSIQSVVCPGLQVIFNSLKK